MDSFYQGYRLTQTDLTTEFYRQNLLYPPPLYYQYSPYWVRYALGYIAPDTGIYYRVGPAQRLPDELQTGLYRPNFIIWEDWYPGVYEIRWLYRDYENSDIQMRKVQFEVFSAGLYTTSITLRDYVDLPASMQVID